MEELLGLGARVYTCCRSGHELEGRLKGWRDLGFEVSGSVCDVSKRAQREALMESVESAFDGKLNILVSLSAQTVCELFYFVFSLHFRQKDLDLLPFSVVVSSTRGKKKKIRLSFL